MSFRRNPSYPQGEGGAIYSNVRVAAYDVDDKLYRIIDYHVCESISLNRYWLGPSADIHSYGFWYKWLVRDYKKTRYLPSPPAEQAIGNEAIVRRSPKFCDSRKKRSGDGVQPIDSLLYLVQTDPPKPPVLERATNLLSDSI